MPLPDPIVFVLVLARLGGLLMAAPLFGHALLPPLVRIGVALALAIVLLPVVPTPADPPATLTALVGAAVVETLLGTALGLVAQFVFAGVQLGGQLAGIQMGFGFATLLDPQSNAQTTVVAELQQLMVLVLFLVLDVHHLLLAALIDSFRAAPVGALVVNGAGLRQAVAMAAEIFAIGVRVAAPVLLVLVLANASLGVLAKTVPQLNVFVVGFPLNVGVGLFVMGAALPFTVRLLAQRFGALDPLIGSLVQGFAHG